MITVIADDLSGAAELAGIAASAGWRSEVVTWPVAAETTGELVGPGRDCTVVAVDADTRSMGEAEAARRMGEVGEWTRERQPEWVFKKIDSVLRGHVRAEGEALRAALGLGKVRLVPANPSKRRVIRAGRYFVEGVPLEETVFAGDPDFPRRTSRVSELLGTVPRSWEVPDVESMEDVVRLAGLTDARTTLAVGAADFFGALLARSTVGLVRPTSSDAVGARLFLCGSAAAWSAREAEAARNGVGLDASDQAELARSDPLLLMGIGCARVEGVRPGELMQRLAVRAQTWMSRQPDGGIIFAEGGATGAALAKVCGWERFRVEAGAPVGIAILKPMTESRWTLWLKPGSYPWPFEVS